jgi:orotidine-5'-phosphate decarboxylase
MIGMDEETPLSETHMPFGDRIILRIRELGHPLCAGLDPHLGRIPALFRRGDMRPGSPETAVAVSDFLCAFVDRLEGKVSVVKPQIAFFERLGWRGIQVLETVVRRAQDRGLLVLLDAKRGDIGSTAEGYASAYLTADAPLPVESITVNPYLGLDSLEPFVVAAEQTGRGVTVLVKTSNPGSGDFQDRLASDDPLFAVVARALTGISKRLEGPETGWSGLAVVVGATYPEHAKVVRECLPRALFLVPGYGAQGGGAAAAVQSFVPGPAGLEGGIVSSSRGLLFPEGSAEAGAADWEAWIDRSIDQARNELGNAVSR